MTLVLLASGDRLGGPSRAAEGDAGESLDAFLRRAELAAQFAPGALVGRFRILRAVGQGAMGTVYAAYDPQLDRDVALKVLLEERGQDAERSEDRLVREARSMAKLAHPNIVTVFEVGVADGRVFFAMQLVDGVTLAEWLFESAPKPSRERVLRLFVDVARAVGAAHRAGVVHRDLKPHNVLVSSAGEAKVTDFGLADTGAPRAAPSTHDVSTVGAASVTHSTLQRTRGLVGTPAYMAPEVLLGARATTQADQFSFAVCLHEALAGRRPYEASSLEELKRVVAAPPRIDGALPSRLARVLERALAREPERRFATMEALADDLALIADDFGGPPSSRRVRYGIAALGLAGAAAIAGGALVRSSRAPAEAAAPSVRAEPLPVAPAPPAPVASASAAPASVASASAASVGGIPAASAPVASKSVASAKPATRRAPVARPEAPAAPAEAASSSTPSSDWLRRRN